ncbi:MAG: hypothetical protein ACLFU1_02945 [Alphaproteobacteria bacterium]
MDLDYQIQPADEDPEIGFPKEERSVEEAGEHFPGMDNVIFDSNPQNTAPDLDIPQWDTGADPLVPDEDIPRPEAISMMFLEAKRLLKALHPFSNYWERIILWKG